VSWIPVWWSATFASDTYCPHRSLEAKALFGWEGGFFEAVLEAELPHPGYKVAAAAPNYLHHFHVV
jgi:hypothetical protein